MGEAETRRGKEDFLCLHAGLKADPGERRGSKEKKSARWKGRRVGVNRWNLLRVGKGRKDMIYFRKSESSAIKGDKRTSQREQVCFSIAPTQNGKDRGNESF